VYRDEAIGKQGKCKAKVQRLRAEGVLNIEPGINFFQPAGLVIAARRELSFGIYRGPGIAQNFGCGEAALSVSWLNSSALKKRWLKGG